MRKILHPQWRRRAGDWVPALIAMFVSSSLVFGLWGVYLWAAGR